MTRFTEEDWNKMLEDETRSYVEDCEKREYRDQIILALKDKLSVEDIADVTKLTVERVKEILSEEEK